MAIYELSSPRLKKLIAQEQDQEKITGSRIVWPVFSDAIEQELLTACDRAISRRRKRHCVHARIYQDTFRKLAALPGMTFAVYAILHQRRDATKRRNIVVTTALLQRWGIKSRHTKRKALKALQNAGLIEVVSNQHGKNPVVRLLPQTQPEQTPRE